MTLPTARGYAGIHRVTVICQTCDHVADLDLPAVVASGRGDVPLIQLRLRCSACGGAKCGIVVSGHSYGLGEDVRP